ncbi:MAG TPA: 3-phosphoshikimate 1-carboxyvinyltransferase [Phycisphaerales bacterium]|nr:3-phosphoshikimate 1-carboxyvinyltransferase [Phycisphaerales bacterium]
MSAPSARSFAELLKSPLGDLPRELAMVPLPGPGGFDVVVRPPGSKSITNRALLMAALASGESWLHGALLDADDARVMIDALRQLGATIDIEDRARGEVRIVGTGGRLKGGGALNLNNAGTATRFLTAAACLADGPVVIDGNERMRQRPIGELAQMLRALGITVEELGAPGCVPLRVHPAGGATGAPVLRIGRTASSQFVSALMIIGPLLPGGLRIEFIDEPTSVSYIRMTLAMMRRWTLGGVDGSIEDRALVLRPGAYRAREEVIEPDASGATYFWGAGAIVPGSRCAVPIDPATSIQSDAGFALVLGAMGAEVSGASVGAAPLRGIDADLTLMPDAAMTLSAVACFARGTTTMTGLRTLRDKETDRIAALCNELGKVGVASEVISYRTSSGGTDEGLRLTPPAPRGGIDCSSGAARVAFDTYDDHRMAMSLALIGLRRPNVVIRDPACVAKTYESFWRDLASLYDSALAGAGSGGRA